MVPDGVGPWLDVLRFVCRGNEDDISWVADWLSMVVGSFDEKPGWHLLLKGRQGTGKNLMLLPLLKYLKPHHQQDVRQSGFFGHVQFVPHQEGRSRSTS